MHRSGLVEKLAAVADFPVFRPTLTTDLEGAPWRHVDKTQRS